ncbi:glycerophosphodiester phosphodiesterase [Planosporangium flavigriseum]|uniref:Glycerophosphoryl diester phosphodiesterase n=1 Tax=Planosporangium flavigriseum TaxID=373681 RepID=A0A8J3LN90_9ACTN|nr:glycerophosphodiester phosphodiesterase [Planosporangium flavigriseum]NJC65649.1 glycerophosphodiester phosphodiesterase [Planosporangium flavigriseum]GIG74812.1 glycerophosphoryl diester phosphodiesterase [Planosporangium flavigriseum]
MAGHLYPYLDAPTPLAFAHRGGAAIGDENTAAAFARCVDLGYRYVETDVQATRDGVPVVFHDATLARMTGDQRRVRDVSWADLASLRVAGGAIVPRLADMLDGWPQLRFNVDIKSEQALEPALAVLRRSSAFDRVLLASFSDDRLRRIRRALGPRVATSMGMREVAKLWAGARLGRAVRVPEGVVAAQVPVRHGRVRVVTSRFVAYAHRLGLQVHVWTVDEPTQIHELLDLGVDGIMTDRIEVLRDVYRARGLWPPKQATETGR